MKGSLFIMGRDLKIPEMISQVSVFCMQKYIYHVYRYIYNIYISHHLPKAIFLLIRVVGSIEQSMFNLLEQYQTYYFNLGTCRSTDDMPGPDGLCCGIAHTRGDSFP